MQQPEDGRAPTMGDIAAHLGVSRQLVSLVLRDLPGASEDTRRRVRQAARDLGYRPHAGARALRRTRSSDLGVVFSPVHATEPEIVEAMYEAAAAKGYHVILAALTPNRSLGEAVDELLGHRCAAIVVMGAEVSHSVLRSIVERTPVPVTTVGGGNRNASYDVVRSSGDKGVAAAVDHLVSLGHRRICFLNSSSMIPGKLRLEGYMRTMAAHGLQPDPVIWSGEYDEEAGAVAARDLLERDELPTAVVAGNDQIAFGLLQVMLRAGVRVPEDLSVTGFDDIRVARLPGVELTTVRQDPALMGAAAVDVAVRRLEDPALRPDMRVVPTSLVVRSSTAAARRP
jgi:DNA-binding LacI/PurR family transcriptional regulator